MFDKLSAAFPADVISWRAQTITNDGNKALALAYIDARDVMRRLDEVVGPDNWQDHYSETAKGRVLCTLSIRINGEWIEKSDGAGDTDVEGDKGALSDAFKRTAVKWGIGRYLYDVDSPWAECEPMKDRDGKLLLNNKQKPMFKQWTARGRGQLAAALGMATPPADAPTGPISDATRDWLQSRIEARQIPVGEVCKAFDVSSLKAINYEDLEDVKIWIRDHKKAA